MAEHGPMPEPDVDPVDGRVARRERNIEAVIEGTIAMLSEDCVFPTMEQVAARSGLSERSLYRYFADPGELLEATIARMETIGAELAHLPAIGAGPLDQRIDDFVTMRLRLYEALGHLLRAAVANAPRLTRLRDQLDRDRAMMREQFERQFAPELAPLKGADRASVASAGDLLTQPESIDFLRRHRRLSVPEAEATLTAALSALLG